MNIYSDRHALRMLLLIIVVSSLSDGLNGHITRLAEKTEAPCPADVVFVRSSAILM